MIGNYLPWHRGHHRLGCNGQANASSNLAAKIFDSQLSELDAACSFAKGPSQGCTVYSNYVICQHRHHIVHLSILEMCSGSWQAFESRKNKLGQWR